MGAAAPAIGGAIVTFFTSTAVVYTIARTVLINLALGALAKKFAKKDRREVPPVNVTIRGSIENRRIVFGTRRVGGVLVFYETSGTNKNTLWYVIAYTGHQVSAINDVWVDSVLIHNADIGGGAAAGGAVSSGQFNGKLSIFKFLGTGAQTVQTDLDTASASWTSNHRLRGCSYIVAKMTRDDTAYPSGSPNSITVLMDGALLYDPRLDSTNGGAGTHRRTDPQTWAFSRNPALAWRWFVSGGSVVNDQASRLVMYGARETDARILDTYVAAAANKCDESISGANAPPGGAQLRYCCDLEASTGESRRDIIEAILATMAGTATNEHGQWRLRAGAYDSPLHTLTQDDLYGELEIQDTSAHDARYNAVGATYVDASSQYVERTTILRTDSAYETQDGGERIQRIIDLRGVINVYQAQRLCEIELRKSRMQRSTRLIGALNLLKIAKQETLNLSDNALTWSSRIFRCHARQFEFNEEAGRVVITAQREDPSVYADMLTADYTTGTSDTDEFVLDGPDAPTGLSSTSLPNSILFTITMPAFKGPNAIVELWEYTSSTPFASATKIAESDSNVIEITKRDTTARFYWVRLRNLYGQVSATFPASTGQSAQALFTQTGDIDPNAATEVRTQQTAGPISTGSQTNTSVTVDTLSFTAADAGDLVVTIAFDGQKTAGAGTTQGFVAVDVGGVQVGASTGALLDGTNRSFVIRFIQAITADSIDVKLRSKHSGGTSTASYSNIDIETEFVKR